MRSRADITSSTEAAIGGQALIVCRNAARCSVSVVVCTIASALAGAAGHPASAISPKKSLSRKIVTVSSWPASLMVKMRTCPITMI